MALVGWFNGIENQTVPSNSLSTIETIYLVVSPWRGWKEIVVKLCRLFVVYFSKIGWLREDFNMPSS